MTIGVRNIVYLVGVLCAVPEAFGQEARTICGRRKVNTVYLIRNGLNAEPGYWPWHAAIFYRAGGNQDYKCGGSIVDANTILTAAHCVHNDHGIVPWYRISVHLGRISLDVTEQHTQILDAREVIVHPEFSIDSITNDIALIKLGGNITMGKFVQPVCLWTMDDDQELIVGKNGTIVGFGFTERDAVSDQLKQAQVGVVHALKCIENDRGVFGTHLTANMFCGGAQNGVSACKGDSGGGMFFKIGGRWFVRGIVSFIPVREGTKLCDGLTYTAFTDVARYLAWIKMHIDGSLLPLPTDALDVDYDEKVRLFNFHTCGIMSQVVLSNGIRWTLPWLAFAGVQSSDDHSFEKRCVLTLITEWYAVGPAHCFNNRGPSLVVLVGGDYESTSTRCVTRKGTRECAYPTQTLDIRKLIIHPAYRKNSVLDDIALVELSSPANTTWPNIKPICISVTPELRSNETSNLSVASFQSKNYSYINQPVGYVGPIDCLARYTEAEYPLSLANERICAQISSDATRNCHQLKAGTPLQRRRTTSSNDRYFLRGLDLHGRTCGSRLPTVYTNVEFYLDWLLYSMKHDVLDRAEVEASSTLHDWTRVQQREPELNVDSCGLVSSTSVYSTTEFPWVGILKAAKDVAPFECHIESTVVLISARYALAPAHIMNDAVSWRSIILGSYIPQTNCENRLCESTYQEVEIKNIMSHPNTTRDNLGHSIVLIELLEPVRLTNAYINPICLPLTEGLRSSEPLETWATSMGGSYVVERKQVFKLDPINCYERFAQQRIFLKSNELPVCADDRDSTPPLSLQPGALLQELLRFSGHERFFLRGMKFYSSLVDESPFMPYLFGNIDRYIGWIVEVVGSDERDPSPSNSTMDSDRVHLSPISKYRENALFNLDTCGINPYPMDNFHVPWMGMVVSNFPYFNVTNCMVTLISDSSVVGPAACFRGNKISRKVLFGGNKYLASLTCLQPPRTTLFNSETQSIPVSEIVYNTDIALVRLEMPVNVVRTNVIPICLPILDGMRTYDRSSMATVLFDLNAPLTTDDAISSVPGRHIGSTDCRMRWDGLALPTKVDNSSICILNQRTPRGKCYASLRGVPLSTTQKSGEGNAKQFLRGLVHLTPPRCSSYYPVVYLNIEDHLEWIVDHIKT